MDIVAFLEIPTFTGLPAHPFFNRIAMYVVPTAIGVAFLALRPRWRARLAPWAFGLAVAALASVQLTMGAGEVMDNVVHGDANPLVEDHESWSKLLRIGLVVQVVVTAVMFRAVRRGSRADVIDAVESSEVADSHPTATPTVRSGGRPIVASAVATAVVALATAGLTVMTAHSGSKSVYQEDGEIMTGETGTDTSPVQGPDASEPSDG